MTPTPEVQERLRRYLLGQLGDEARGEVEKELFTHDEIYQELLVVEDEMVDEYLGDKLGHDDRTAFETNFLGTPGRRQKLRFGRALNRYVTAQPDVRSARQPHEKWRSGRPQPFRRLFSSRLAIAAFAILVIAVALGIWRSYFHQSDLDKGLIALNQAYREQRPLESRISKFDYAPFPQTRGSNTPDRFDSLARNRAEAILSSALTENPTAAAPHHAIGKVYLAKKQFDDAIKEFDEALKNDSKNAQLYSDLGAAWLEKGKIDLDKGKADPSSPLAGKGMEEIGRGLENLDRALKLNPNLLEALFNRALCHQYLTLAQQAAEDWRDYLKRDSTSSWAEEARGHLKRLEEEKNQKAQTNAELLQGFRAAYATHDDTIAWAALGPSRARTGNAIVQTLIDDYLSAAASGSADAASALDLLEYAGAVEARKSEDQYTAHLSTIYRKASTRQQANLKQARQLLKSGIDKYNNAELSEAIQFFSDAKAVFSAAGDDPEALFAEAWIGYSSLRTPHHENSTELFERLARAFEAKAYKSLEAQALFAQADAVGRNQFSQVVERAGRALIVSEQIGDTANAVRCLQAGTSMQLILGNYRDSLTATYRALSLAQSLPPDPKLTWPFYHEASLDFYFLDMPSVALQFENEALRLALSAGLPFQTNRSYDRLALLYEGQNNFAEARNNLEQARAAGQKVRDEATRNNILAHSTMTSARLSRKMGDLKQATESVDDALRRYHDLKLELYEYAAHKEKFLDLMALNDNDAAQGELDITLSWFEKNQREISEESYKNKFFETGQSTYDLAIDFQVSRKNDEWRAFEYAESARARSLLNLASSGSVATGGTNPDLKISGDRTSLKLDEIQNRLPAETQLVEYSILDDRVIIWLISKDRKGFAEAAISRADLNAKILDYLKLLRSSDSSKVAIRDIGKQLYASLISPIENSLKPGTQLCFVPDDKLNFLPFATLISPTSGKYLLEEYATETSPSATIFITNSDQAQKKSHGGAERALVVGAPNFDREKFADLADLPDARRESEEVAKLYNAEPLIGAAATAARVRKELQTADVAHFATHAVADEQTPLLSKLLLSTDGLVEARANHVKPSFIQASEIYAMKLPGTKLAVLSACQTGIERSYRGEGAIGLARPFMVAGVPLVIGTLWPVESHASADLMISFHRHRKQDRVSTVEALRRAQLEALQNPQSANYDWAAFVAIGGYASF